MSTRTALVWLLGAVLFSEVPLWAKAAALGIFALLTLRR